MPTIAALGADGLWLAGAAGPEPVELARVRNAGGLLNAMALRKIAVLYLHRSALEAMGLPLELEPPPPGERRPEHPFVADARYAGERVGRCLTPSIVAADGALELYAGAWQDGAGDPFADATDAGELLAAVTLFALAFAQPAHPEGWLFRHTAMTTGWRLMHGAWRSSTRRRRGAQLLEQLRAHDGLVELEGVEPGVQTEIPFGSWTPPELPAPAPGKVAAGWDINGQRLAACSRLELGVGEPVEKAPGVIDGLPGYHLVSAVDRPHGDRIPPIFEPGWHTTPRVAMARYLGIGFELERSIVWPEHVAYLDPFYQSMREARGVLHELAAGGNRAAAIALGALKQTYLQPLGRLRSHRAREAGDVYYRPAWYDAVIGQELARQWMRLAALADNGEQLLAVYFDAIVCQVEPGRTPAPLELSSQLGKWKAIGELELEPARQLLAGENGPEVGRLLKALKNGAGPIGEDGGPAPIVRNDAPTIAPRADGYRPAHGGYPVPAS